MMMMKWEASILALCIFVGDRQAGFKALLGERVNTTWHR